MTRGTLLLSAAMALLAHSATASSIISLGGQGAAEGPSIVALGAPQLAAPEAPTVGAADPVQTAALPEPPANPSIAAMGTPATNTEARDEEKPRTRPDEMPLVLRGDFGPGGDPSGSAVAVSAPVSAQPPAQRATYGQPSGGSAAAPASSDTSQPSPAQLDR